MNIRINLLIVLAALAMVSPMTFAEATSDKSAKYTASIEKGLTWFAAQEFRRRDSVAFSHWIADLVEQQYPDTAKVLRAKGKALYAEREDDYLLRKLIGGKQDFPMDAPMLHRYRVMLLMKLKDGELGRSAGGTEDFLGMALYASDPRLHEGFEPVYQALLTSPLNRYGATHQLLALVFLRQEKAHPQANVDGAIKRVSDGIAEELGPQIARDVFTDLIAESLALLAMAGQFHLIKAEWLDFLVKHQQADGSWRQAKTESNADMLDMDQHATMLALYALLQRPRGYP